MQYPWIKWHNPETVVFAHANGISFGKGMGQKAKDEFGAYACYECHMTYDGHISRPKHITKQMVNEMFAKGMERTRKLLQEKGLL